MVMHSIVEEESEIRIGPSLSFTVVRTRTVHAVVEVGQYDVAKSRCETHGVALVHARFELAHCNLKIFGKNSRLIAQ